MKRKLNANPMEYLVFKPEVDRCASYQVLMFAMNNGMDMDEEFEHEREEHSRDQSLDSDWHSDAVVAIQWLNDRADSGHYWEIVGDNATAPCVFLTIGEVDYDR